MSGSQGHIGVAALAVCLLLGDSVGLAAEVRVTKSVGSRVTVTDNVDLEPDDRAKGSVITSVIPGATATVDGNRLDLLFAGTVALQHFSHDGSFRINQNVRGAANAELWEDWLYLDLEASSKRQLLEPESRVSASDTGRGGRETVTVLEASPYLAHSFGNWADGELRYRRVQTFSGETGDTMQDEQRLFVESGTRFTRPHGTLLVEHLDHESDFNRGFDGNLERWTGEVSGRYALWRGFSPSVVAGYDKVETDDPRDLSGPFYLLGFTARPGPRSAFNVGVGERYDDLWVRGAFHYDITARLRLSGEIDRVLETTTDRLSNRRRGNVLDPVTGEVVTEDLNEDGEEGVAVTWRGNVGLDGDYGRNRFNLDLLYVDRKFANSEETTYGLRGVWTRRLSRTWSTRLTGFATHLDGDFSHDTLGAQAALEYLIYTNTLVSFGVSHTERYSERPNDEYTESTAFVQGRLKF